MRIKIKKLHPNAKIPSYAKPGDAGLDLTAVSKEWDEEKKLFVMGTGIALEIPEGYFGMLVPRSSICKVPLMLSNGLGVLDSKFRGEIKFMFRPIGWTHKKNYDIGDRIGQLIVMPFPYVDFMEVEELSETDRGSGGWGSTGT